MSKRLKRAYTETDVLHIVKLPVFKAMLDVEDTELLLTYLTVPQMALPLVLRFFAERDIGPSPTIPRDKTYSAC